jgi:hypothetical protein
MSDTPEAVSKSEQIFALNLNNHHQHQAILLLHKCTTKKRTGRKFSHLVQIYRLDQGGTTDQAPKNKGTRLKSAASLNLDQFHLVINKCTTKWRSMKKVSAPYFKSTD